MSHNQLKQNKNSTNYAQYYKDVCVQTKNTINHNVSHGLKGHDLILNLDLLSEKDLEPVGIVLQNCRFRHVTFLGRIAENISIKEFYMNGCGLQSPDLEKISKGIIENSSLLVLDLENNLLKGDAGRIIGKLTSNSCKKRDDYIWLCSLRNEEPDEDISLKGICEINLARNQFDSRAAKELCNFLQFDGWTRSINLRHNLITEEGIKEFRSLLDNNKSLICVDLRDNEGFDSYYSQQIYKKLHQNYENCKKTRMLQDMHRNLTSEDVKQQGESDYKESLLNQQMAEQNNNFNEENYENYDENEHFKNQFENQHLNQQQQQLYENNDEYQNSNSKYEQQQFIDDDENAESGEQINSFPQCSFCSQIQKKFLNQKSINRKLAAENKKLVQQLNDIANSGVKSFSSKQQNQEEQQNGEIMNRIENMMIEVTRLMDNLEHSQNSETNNFSYNLSNTINNNTGTQILLNNNNNQNNTFSHISGVQSNNNSKLIPQNLQQQQQFYYQYPDQQYNYEEDSQSKKYQQLQKQQLQHQFFQNQQLQQIHQLQYQQRNLNQENINNSSNSKHKNKQKKKHYQQH